MHQVIIIIYNYFAFIIDFLNLPFLLFGKEGVSGRIRFSVKKQQAGGGKDDDWEHQKFFPLSHSVEYMSPPIVIVAPGSQRLFWAQFQPICHELC